MGNIEYEEQFRPKSFWTAGRATLVLAVIGGAIELFLWLSMYGVPHLG
jgi:hypothetical protein